MDDIITDEEFAILYDVNCSKNLDLPYDDYERFDLDNMENDECIAEFRVTKNDLPVLAEALQIPDTFVCPQKSGRKHDAAMLANSGLLQQLQQYAISPNGRRMCIYGDPAYPLRPQLQCPFRNVPALTPQMQAFNTSMSSVRISVEWLFGDIVNFFKFVDYKKNLKIGLSSVGKMYVVCAILQNALTCLYRNFTSQYFDLEPPTVQDYFA
ncbi:hypothetical protein QZH41_009525 [Actinostola sp. cb2023]|nr:hypothetical protein QZH41_008256 [Actinostola sp. cb2023]KAK3730019.1 hypothetical protein QZH41_009525 [Actinostola sp. cb2023]